MPLASPSVLSKYSISSVSSAAPTGSGVPLALAERDHLYLEFRPLVKRLIRKYGRDLERREDLQGEIYCLFCDLLDAYDTSRGIPLKAYLVHQLTASVYTLARSRWRQERREVPLNLQEDGHQHQHGDAAATAASTMSTSIDPSDQWDQEITRQQVLGLLPQAMTKLPPRQRQVVIWRYYDERSFEEIARSLNVQVATARSLLRHGLSHLRRSFAESGLSFQESLL